MSSGDDVSLAGVVDSVHHRYRLSLDQISQHITMTFKIFDNLFSMRLSLEFELRHRKLLKSTAIRNGEFTVAQSIVQF